MWALLSNNTSNTYWLGARLEIFTTRERLSPRDCSLEIIFAFTIAAHFLFPYTEPKKLFYCRLAIKGARMLCTPTVNHNIELRSTRDRSSRGRYGTRVLKKLLVPLLFAEQITSFSPSFCLSISIFLSLLCKPHVWEKFNIVFPMHLNFGKIDGLRKIGKRFQGTFFFSSQLRTISCVEPVSLCQGLSIVPLKKKMGFSVLIL